jgi:mono/diheme cytochrome c family protein
MNRGWSLVLVVSLAASACSENMTEQPTYRPQEPPRLHSPSGSVPRMSRVHRGQASPGAEDRNQSGARLFRINCAHCHGPTAEGDGPVAPYLSAQAANLRASHVQQKPPSALYAIITDGSEVMPAFKGELSSDERWALVDFIGSMAGAGQTTSRQTSETLDPGIALYATYCQACHGPRGKGDGPAAIAMQPKPANLAGGRLKKGETADAIARTISEGVQGTPMPGFGYLSERDRRALAEHVVSLRRGGAS